jgi:hypothetical protein
VAAVGLAALGLPVIEVGGAVERGYARVELHWAVVAPLFPLLAVAQPRIPRAAVAGEVAAVAFSVWVTAILLDFVLFAEYTRLPGFAAVVVTQIAGLVTGALLAWRR